MEDFDKDLYKSEGKWICDYEQLSKDFSVCMMKGVSRKFFVYFCEEAKQFLALHNRYTQGNTDKLA